MVTEPSLYQRKRHSFIESRESIVSLLDSAPKERIVYVLGSLARMTQTLASLSQVDQMRFSSKLRQVSTLVWHDRKLWQEIKSRTSSRTLALATSIVWPLPLTALDPLTLAMTQIESSASTTCQHSLDQTEPSKSSKRAVSKTTNHPSAFALTRNNNNKLHESLQKTLKKDGFESLDEYQAHKATMPSATPTYVVRGPTNDQSIAAYQ